MPSSDAHLCAETRRRPGRPLRCAPRLVVLATLVAAGARAEASPPTDITDSPFASRVRTLVADSFVRPRRPSRISSPGALVVKMPSFVYIRDRGLVLPSPPWFTEAAYAEAFDLVHRAYYDVQPDRARVILVFTTFDEGGDALFYLPLANNVQGLGEGKATEIFDDTADFGLDGDVWMGSFDRLREAGDDYLREAFLHEIAHRWSAYVAIDHPSLPHDALRGRQGSHWSFLLNTDNSPMEGNRWQEATDGRHYTDTDVSDGMRFHPLDLYLMGVLPPMRVPALDLITQWDDVRPSWFQVRDESPPAHRSGLEVSLHVRSTEAITIDHVIAGSGTRFPPAWAQSMVWPVGIVFLSDGISRVTLEDLQALDERVRTLVEDFAAATDGRVVLDFEVEGAGTLPMGSECSVIDDCDRTRSDLCAPPGEQQAPICSRTCTTRENCGAGFCCAPFSSGSMCIPLRLCSEGVDPNGPGTSGPKDPTQSGGPDASGLETGDDDACGCTVTRRDSIGLGALALAVLAAVTVRRSSRRSR